MFQRGSRQPPTRYAKKHHRFRLRDVVPIQWLDSPELSWLFPKTSHKDPMKSPFNPNEISIKSHEIPMNLIKTPNFLPFPIKNAGSFQFVVCERLPGRVYPLFGFNLSSRGVHNPKKMVGIQLIQLNYVRAK